MCMAQIPAAPLVHNDPPPKFFVNGKIHWKFGVFCKACIVTFQKSNIWPNKFLEIFFSYLRKSILGLSIFSKFQLWCQIWQWSSLNFVFKFKSYNLQLITFSKRYLKSKSFHWNWRYLQLNVKNRMKLDEKAIWILVDFTRFFI